MVRRLIQGLCLGSLLATAGAEQVPELLVEDSECAANEECALNALQRHALQKKAPVAKMYGQCGGAKWKGPTTCEDGGKCVMTNEWYAQCEPEAAAEVPAPSPGAVEAKDEKQEQPPPEKTMGPLPSRPKQPAPKTYETLNPIIARGNFLYDSVTGDRFFAKGVAYNPRNEKYDHSFGPSVHVAGWVDKCVPGDPKGGYWGYTADVVSDEKEEFWTEDLEAMANMGANTIRLYNLDPRLSHAKFMKKAASLGIYAIVPLTGKDYGFLPAFPAPECYTKDLEDYGNVGVNLLGFAKTLMKEFSQYNNTLMFTAANELAQLDKNGYSAFPCVKAFVRDLHNYQADCAENMRKVPLIYSDVDTGGGIARKVVADYLTCALESEADAVDAYGLNVYSWCDETYPGDGKADNFQYSPYKDIKQDFEDFSVPFIFSEFGCNLGVFKTKCPYPGGRTWPDVKHFLGEDMGQFMSGAVAFQWSMDKEEYGLTLSPGFLAGQDKLYLLDNYFQLQKQYLKYQVNGTWNAPASEVDKCSFVPSDVAPMEYTHKRPACPSKAMWTKVQHEKRVDTVVDWDVLPPPAISPIGNATLNISECPTSDAVPPAALTCTSS
mmetsp:Transcript_26370/g.62874  ORF Transcript_26370/g.62874 Transcript_26370/m.62874 type:complete len:605 (-) Transcript_26370:63-1877(-)|eukprot:CAMPEP_0181436650 /NCGR_PEP_ID=MMETSP1110-20121109/20961_1 /TAXON_ID=174948 /ORGANISM="Symbiodinium sp., Strain CCMP421" /LENGTH=604 /DNA_ID=CAMNT_0023560229 /DNA_START=64 /DNA_END=1878 /DNA_ORIENTATION=-